MPWCRHFGPPQWAATTLILAGIAWGSRLTADQFSNPPDPESARPDDSPPAELLDSDTPRRLPLAPTPHPLVPAAREPRISSLDSERSLGVREAIDRLLPQATAEEREVWFQEFKDLPPGVVEDLLKLRREVHGKESPLWSPDSIVQPPSLPTLPLAEFPSEPGVADDTTRETLQTLERLALQNLAHAQTPGYCRVVPNLFAGQSHRLLMDEDLLAPGQQAPGSLMLSLRYGGYRIDLQPANPVPTHRSLDVAISGGPGFFAISTPDGTAFTRSGRLLWDAQQRLAVQFADTTCPLVPEITRPEGGAFTKILSTGEVHTRSHEATEWTVVGTIVPMMIDDPARLQYAPGGWLIDAEGNAAMPIETPWSLISGHLEQSNVSIVSEKHQLEWVRELKRMLASGDSAGQQLD